MKVSPRAATFLAGFTASVTLLVTSALMLPHVTFADEPLPPAAPVEVSSTARTVTFNLIGDTIKAQGNFVVEMVGESIHISVPTGAAKVEIVGKQEIDLTAGDDILLIPITSATIRSIGVNVLKGEAVVGPVAATHDPETGEMVGESVLTTQTAFSVSTGKIDNSADVDNSAD